MARCPDCNKFVSIEQEDPEWDPEVEADDLAGTRQTGRVTGEVRLALSCADCGTELAEATQEAEIAFTLEHEAEPGCLGLKAPEGPELELEANATATDRYEGKGRGARHFYGADLEATVKCLACEAEVTVMGQVEEQASAFESLA